jgi:hypothetical protein
MAQYAFTFSSGDTVTPTKLNNARTVSEIVDADIKSDAAIAGTKIAPNFGSQNVVTTGLEVIGGATQPSGDFVYSSTVSSTGARATSVSAHSTNNVSNAIVRYSNNTTSQAFAAGLSLAKSNTTTAGTHVAVVNNQLLGTVSAFGSDGTNFVNSAGINFAVDGAVAAGSVPGSISFTTRAAGSTAAPAFRMRIKSDGEVQIAGTTDRGNFNLQCNGTGVWGAGAYTNGSDERLKENIAEITEGLEVVNKLRPVSFNYKPEHSRDTSKQAGFIAQELLVALEGRDYLEGTVSQGPEYYNVAYQNLIPVMAKAIQQLSAKVAALEAA